MSTRKSREQRETAERHAWCKKHAEELNAEASRKRIAKQKQEILQQMLRRDEREQAKKEAQAEYLHVKPKVKQKRKPSGRSS